MEINGPMGVVEEGTYELNTFSPPTVWVQNRVFQTWAILILAGACTGWFFFWQGNRVRRQRRLMPPGPPSWPIVGFLVQIMASRLPMHEILTKLADTYGPVMFFYLGSLPCLVVSSAEAAEVVLKDSNFSHRATETLLYTVRHLEFDNQGFLDHYNLQVKLLRKLCATELMTNRSLAAFAKARMEDTQETILNVARISEEGKHLVNVKLAIGHQGLNSMSKMLLGRRLYGAINIEAAQVLQEFSEILPDVLQLAGTLYWGDLFPALRWLDVNGLAKTYRKRRLQMEKAYRAIFEEVKSKLVKVGIDRDRDNDPASFLEVLLSQQEENNMSDTTIMATITDLIIGGHEAFGTTTEWAIIELVRNPEKMQRLQKEIDSVVGRSRAVEESDLAKLPYFRACVRETLRLYPSLPLLLPRETEVPTTVNDYYIPPKTLVLVNAWQIARDNTYYNNSDNFEPERFLDSEEITDYHFLPFGGGRRVCVGGKLGLIMLQLTLASLVHAYDWAPAPGIEPQDIKVAPSSSMVLTPRFPIYFRTAPRLEVDVYGNPFTTTWSRQGGHSL